jgi:hypothetical protein
MKKLSNSKNNKKDKKKKLAINGYADKGQERL